MAQFSPTSTALAPSHRYPIHAHRVPSHLACNLTVPPGTTKTTLHVSTDEVTEFSLKKALLLKDYKHAVFPVVNKELTKMFITYEVLTFVHKHDIPSNATFICICTLIYTYTVSTISARYSLCYCLFINFDSL